MRQGVFVGRYFSVASLGQGTFHSQPDAAADVTTFWKQSARFWFEKNAGFDAFFRCQFGRLHDEILKRRHDDWLADPYGSLALILMTDQYPRNAFRGTGDMYRADTLAVQYARTALKAGYPEKVEERLRLFFFLPFSHSEDLADQRISVAFTERLGQPWSSKARDYMEIISRFGRFPHRNEMLGRPSTQEEMAFLQRRPEARKPTMEAIHN